MSKPKEPTPNLAADVQGLAKELADHFAGVAAEIGRVDPAKMTPGLALALGKLKVTMEGMCADVGLRETPTDASAGEMTSGDKR